MSLLAILSVALLIAVVALAAISLMRKKRVYAYELPVVGLYYRDWLTQEAADKIMEYDILALERDADNIYDVYAVKVMLGNTHIGFIPKTHSRRISSLLNSGFKYKATVSKIDRLRWPTKIAVKLILYK
jgi:hypothetical protein